jgi:hypothetical protein
MLLKLKNSNKLTLNSSFNLENANSGLNNDYFGIEDYIRD